MSELVNLENRLGVLKSKQNQFVDFDLSFKKNPITNDVRKKRDAAAVNQSLKNLILTNFFERPFQPSFGGNIWEDIFEPLDDMSVINIKNRMENAISNFEPRVRELSINFKPLKDENTLVIVLTYQVPASEEVFSTQFSIERIR